MEGLVLQLPHYTLRATGGANNTASEYSRLAGFEESCESP